MSVLDKKRKVFGNIAAAKTLTNGMPKLKNSSSFPSINNNGNTITFLTDLIKSLIGFNELVKSVTDFLTTILDKLEIEIKNALKTELKSIVSCGINPSLPDFMKSNGTGIVIQINKIDFLDIFKVDPNSTSGKLIYEDTTGGLTSTDLNTFLFNVIQNDGTTNTWNGILDFTFQSLDPSGVNPNNSLVIKANQNYDTKTLNDLNNDFIDSLDLFQTSNLVNKIIDTIFGSISIQIGKTRKQLEAEGKINAVIDKIVNSDEGETISDTYFTFDNEELSEIQYEADERKKGRIKVLASTTIDAKVPESQLTIFNEEMGTAVTTQQKKETLVNNLNNMANTNAKNATNEQDKTTIKLNFIQKIIDNIIKAIVGIVLSPKVVVIFLINFKIVYGPDATFTDGVDFIKKNKKLLKNIMKKVSGELTQFLLKRVTKELTQLISESQAKIQIDKAKNQKVQLASLVGVPQEVLRIIKGL
jgi:hypothetical protein